MEHMKNAIVLILWTIMIASNYKLAVKKSQITELSREVNIKKFLQICVR